jgi:hypothetical protein
MIVREYIREDGAIPFKRWFESLDYQAAAKVSVALARLETGRILNRPGFAGDSKS